MALTPPDAERLIEAGLVVRIERDAGRNAGFADDEYRRAGCIIDHAEGVWASDVVVKVKEPQPDERQRLTPSLTLFSFLHLAADAALTQALVDSRCTAIAFESVVDPDGRFPLLEPMSELAGRLAVLQGAADLLGSRGVLAGGACGARPATVVIIGAGNVGLAAVETAVGLGARVILLDAQRLPLARARERFGDRIETSISAVHTTREALTGAELVIGAVMRPGARAPIVVTRDMLGLLATCAVVVDVAVDQGGCLETTHPTTYEEPTYVLDAIVHRCLTNMPAAVPRTASELLSSALVPWVAAVAEGRLEQPALAQAITVKDGRLMDARVAEAHGISQETAAALS